MRLNSGMRVAHASTVVSHRPRLSASHYVHSVPRWGMRIIPEKEPTSFTGEIQNETQGRRCGVGNAPPARKVHPDRSIATRFEFWRAAFDLHNDHEQLLHREYCIITAGFLRRS